MLRRSTPTVVLLTSLVVVTAITLASSSASAAPTAAARSATSLPQQPAAKPAPPSLDPDAPAPKIDAELQAVLSQHGIDHVVSIQDANGATAYLDSDGDFFLDIADATANSVASGSVVAAAWNAGVCVGNFHTIQRVSGPSLQWGATNNCYSTTNLYLHDLKVTLRDTCVGPFCVAMDELWQRGSAAGGYDALQVVSGVDYCYGAGAADDRGYDMVAYPVVRSVQYGPIVSGKTDIQNCDVEPG